MHKTCCTVLGSLALGFPGLQAAEPLAALAPFFKQHCHECHGPKKQKGEIRLDTLGKDLAKHETLEVWQAVLDQLNLGEMPPKKQPQPATAEVQPIVDTLTATLARAYEKARSTGGGRWTTTSDPHLI